MRLPVGPGSRPLHVVVSVHACGHCPVRPCGTAGDSVCRVHAHAQLPQLPPARGQSRACTSQRSTKSAMASSRRPTAASVGSPNLKA